MQDKTQYFEHHIFTENNVIFSQLNRTFKSIDYLYHQPFMEVTITTTPLSQPFCYFLSKY